jgi:phosphatidylglycerol:prolipoprotein diacylglycerol transferase
VIQFPDVSPVAISLGPVAVHWYGLSYVAGIALGWWYLRMLGARGGDWTREDIADVVFYVALGGVLGGRIGYILFYNFSEYWSDPTTIFAVWRGGMSFHGGVLGVILAMYIFGRKTARRFFQVSDFVLPAVPIGLGLGRVANFINQELWGAPTQMPWGVLFTHPAAGAVARHPSQLYEAALEGVGLFIVLLFTARSGRAWGTVTGVFLALYGIFRCAIEFVREPDGHIGYLYGEWLTMGQVLSLPMILCGLVIIAWPRRA